MLENIPLELRVYPQWVLWRYEDRSASKPTKVPYSAINGRLASPTDPRTWATFEQTLHIYLNNKTMYDGVGFVLSDNDPYSFIDLDYPENDASTVEKQHQIYNEFQSYSEISVSGKGLHIIVKGSIPSGRKRSKIEVYSSMRYMTMTGDVYRNLPIAEYSDKLLALWETLGKSKSLMNTYMGCDVEIDSDETIIKRATEASNGELFAKLWAGDWSDYSPNNTNTHSSEADFALIDILAFYTQNTKQITRLFRMSGLGQREKAKRDDYIGYMLNRCFDNMLPPVDLDGLQNQLNEILEKRKRAEIVKKSDAEPKLEIKPKVDVYRLPPGLLGEIAEFIFQQAPQPVPEIALAGALGFMCGITGRAWNFCGQGLNQYVLLLAKTSSGKEAMVQGIEKMMFEVLKYVPSAFEFIGPAEIASPQAILKYMNSGPKSFLSIVGEYGLKMQQMCATYAAPHLVEFRRFLLYSYMKSGEGNSIGAAITADRERNTKTILSPSFSILGESTPERFYEGLHEGLITEGLLPRFTVIEYHGNMVEFNENHMNVKPSCDLIEKLSTLCSYALTLNSQNKALEVEIDENANKLLRDFREYCRLQVNSSEREVTRQFWSRGRLKAQKTAALIAVGVNPYNPKIDSNMASWAINLVTHDIRNFINRFNAGEIGVDNDETKQLNFVIKEIKNYIIEPWDKIKSYIPNMGNLYENKVIPFAFLQRKTASIQIFRKDKLGANNSLKRAISVLTERGDIQEISKAKMATDFGTTSRAFMISNFKVFELE